MSHVVDFTCIWILYLRRYRNNTFKFLCSFLYTYSIFCQNAIFQRITFVGIFKRKYWREYCQ